MAQIVQFDMAATSFNDHYDGCVDQMEEKLRALQDGEAWEEAAARWNETKASVSVPEGFKDEYAIATLAYTQMTTFVRKFFNIDVKKAGASEEYYLRNFQDKPLHYFLTRALQVLQANSSVKCRQTYYHLKGFLFIAKMNTMARFGYFASSSLNRTGATVSWGETFFTIETCYGAYIKEFSFYPEQEEVLIPPFELFRVVNSYESGGAKYIELVSAGIFSQYNCVYVNDFQRVKNPVTDMNVCCPILLPNQLQQPYKGKQI
ncbi:erythroblast NAD(P)(+)--arginine ADP-ribosyltransferase-like [Heteronotia binoei]|uniref:erythroblast NAD(P)(+)--arginine ADP-ribosyltransferase-like n=1 Tax=Heteronotia binoei TaxID=13085 RepID=UPI00292F349B|nr:erythroblast NAD(P)(+)--arginine ADP-ribosyltransferase-like [Heteronotia binoei]